MQATVTWQEEGLRFTARSASGHQLEMDSNGETGPTPMEYVINAVGGCSSIDVVMILQKGRQDVTACRCELKGERAQSSPRVFTSIHAHFVVEGRALNDRQVARAVQLSFDKYCSVSKMLDGSVDITYSHESVEAGG